jgi:hypothetical protein
MAHISVHIGPIHIAIGSADILQSITELKDLIMATAAELTASLDAATAQITKIGTETTTLLQKIADLEAAIAAGFTTTPEIDAALAALKAQVQVGDDLVVDAPPASA